MAAFSGLSDLLPRLGQGITPWLAGLHSVSLLRDALTSLVEKYRCLGESLQKQMHMEPLCFKMPVAGKLSNLFQRRCSKKRR